jgi:DNA-binding transcriptional ArsR family regulator
LRAVASRETLTLDQPEQLKALGHPLRVRTIEVLCQAERPLTNRDLAERLGVDPGHLHFHVRMLLKAGLIELAEDESRGREKPYRAVARHLRVDPDLLATGGAAEAQASFVRDVQHSLEQFAASGRFRIVQVALRGDLEKVRAAVDEVLTGLLAMEEPEGEGEHIVITAFVSPPAKGEGD